MSLRVVLLLMLLPVATLADEGPAPSELARLLGGDDEGFAKALTPRSFEFPADHGPHPEFRNEWWYVTGNLDAEGGRRFGYELTIFRFSLSPTEDPSPSAWRSNQVYIAHLAVTDAQGEFPERAPEYPVLWVVKGNGTVPWGERVQLAG